MGCMSLRLDVENAMADNAHRLHPTLCRGAPAIAP
jgi:hypothetical protein